MPTFRICFLYGSYYLITIDESTVTLKSLRKEIEKLLPSFRQLNDYSCYISGKPPHILNLNNEQEFNKHQALITDGCYIWLKFIV
jgi:hypothetical protein